MRKVNSNGQRVLAYAPESASATIDDVGTAHMAAGVANVPIDRAFVSTIERTSQYHVFLTPMGDTRGLYVSLKTLAAFEVREAQGGRSTVSFDYRIVARPLGVKDNGLALAPPTRKMPSRKPRHRQGRQNVQRRAPHVCARLLGCCVSSEPNGYQGAAGLTATPVT